MRVTVSRSCFPQWERNLNKVGRIGRERIWQVAVNTIFAQSVCLSHIILPVRKPRNISQNGATVESANTGGGPRVGKQISDGPVFRSSGKM